MYLAGKMPVRPLNLNIMIGDTMSNDQNKYPSPIEKFKNDHLTYDAAEPNKNSTSSNSSVSSSPKLLSRFPNNFRQWPDPPPPPIRTRKFEKKTVSIRKRPGSADPRFHRHLSDHTEKPSLVTQSDVKILKKSALVKDANILQHNSESTPMACYRRNLHINHVNEWLQSQVHTTPNSIDSGLPNIEYSKSSIGTSEVVMIESKFSQTEKVKHTEPLIKEKHKIKTRENHCNTDNKSISLKTRDTETQVISKPNQILNNLSDGEDYRETLNLMPNDVVHKYPDYSKTNQFEPAESEASFVSELTEKLICPTGQLSAPCLESQFSKNKAPLRSRFNHIEDFFERNSKQSPLIERNDSQLLLMCSNPEANGFFCKSFPYTLSWSAIIFWMFLTMASLSLLGVLLNMGPIVRDSLGSVLARVYGKPPEETFVDKYFILPFLEGPMCMLGKLAEKFLALLVMPVNARY